MSKTPKSIKGTKTEVNLANSYVAESCAYSRYTFYAQQAQKESYFQYANIFNETAANELHHAKIYFKYLTEGAVTVPNVGVDAGIIGTTAENLKVASEEEQKEGVDLYIRFAKVAEEEGFEEIAGRVREIAEVEEQWQCLVCGYIHEGTEPPTKCPACYHPSQHFMPMEDNI